MQHLFKVGLKSAENFDKYPASTKHLLSSGKQNEEGTK